ncbi:hypothetical protein BRC61_06870 [Halobacteriales archaeon QH_10_65_19]|nr:MAG: hypothetical protein BRC61_06870 [Halobacteriales archaeon QH_10_65_19]
MGSERLQFVAVLLLSGLLLAASLGLGGSSTADEPDPERLVQKAVDSRDSEPIKGVRTEVFQRDDQFEMATVAVTRQPPGHSRIEVLEAVEADSRSDLTVINESTMWRYFQDEQRAVRVDADRQVDDRTQTFHRHTRELLDQYEATYVRTETVEDRETHVVELTPPDDTAIKLSLDVQAGNTDYEFELEEARDERWFVTRETLWIDKETTYPVKQEVEWTDEEGNVVGSNIQKYHELTVGADIDEEEAFDFDPPERANVTDPTVPEMETYPSVESAASAVEFTVPEPVLPSGYELEEAMVQTFDGDQGVTLTYTRGAQTITVRVSERTLRADGDRIVDSNVGDVDGTLLSVDGRTSLAWDCGDLSYRVSGLPDVDALTGIADSVGCDSDSTGTATWPDNISPGPPDPFR